MLLAVERSAVVGTKQLSNSVVVSSLVEDN